MSNVVLCRVCDERPVEVRNQCKRCYYREKYHTDNLKIRYRVKNKERQLQQIYGITLDDYFDLLNRQNGKCPICEEALIHFWSDKYRANTAARIDHDHKSGRVRGLVCNSCNRNRIGTNTKETATRLLTYLTTPSPLEQEIIVENSLPVIEAFAELRKEFPANSLSDICKMISTITGQRLNEVKKEVGL